MGWHTGTATGFKNLLALVVGHAELDGWTVNRNITGTPLPRTDEIMLEGPGFGVGKEVYMGIRTYEDAVNNHYCLQSRAYTAFDPARSWDQQPGASPNTVYTRLWDGPMTYWLSVSDRRLLLVVKCSNTYHSLYAGFFNAFATPVEYPYPFYLAGDSGSVGPFGAVEIDTRCVAFPGNNAAYIRDIGGLWRSVAVHNDSETWDYQGVSASRYTIWPYLSPGNSGSFSSLSAPPLVQIESLPGYADTLFMMNCYVVGCFDRLGVLGVLEGLYWLPGNTMSAEQELTFNSENYHAFIAISRSIESPSQFYAVKEA